MNRINLDCHSNNNRFNRQEALIDLTRINNENQSRGIQGQGYMHHNDSHDIRNYYNNVPRIIRNLPLNNINHNLISLNNVHNNFRTSIKKYQ